MQNKTASELYKNSTPAEEFILVNLPLINPDVYSIDKQSGIILKDGKYTRDTDYPCWYATINKLPKYRRSQDTIISFYDHTDRQTDSCVRCLWHNQVKSKTSPFLHSASINELQHTQYISFQLLRKTILILSLYSKNMYDW